MLSDPGGTEGVSIMPFAQSLETPACQPGFPPSAGKRDAVPERLWVPGPATRRSVRPPDPLGELVSSDSET